MSERCPGCGHVPHLPNFLCNYDQVADDQEPSHEEPFVLPRGNEGDLAWPDAPLFASEFATLLAGSASVSQLEENGRRYLLEDHVMKLVGWVESQVKSKDGSGLLERAIRLEVAVDVSPPGHDTRRADLDADTREVILTSQVDTDPPSLTFARLLELRRSLQWVEWNLEGYMDAYGKNATFCANRWYERDQRRINETLERAVGPCSPDDEVTTMYPWLKTRAANLWVFFRFYNRLPDCRGCGCA
jgi:hypothetical protein